MRRVWYFILITLFMSGCRKDDPADPPSGPFPVITAVSPLSGPKGTTVEIRGTSFNTNAPQVSVYIGTNRVQPVLLTDTMLKFVIPPRCGSGQIVVTMGDITLAGPDFNYVYTVVVSDYAGLPGQPGFLDGTAQSALFNHPRGLTMDSLGNLYVADELNHSIRLVSTNGSVTTFAGAGVAGYADGVGINARFNHPYDIDFDRFFGVLYIADKLNHCIRRISSGGNVLTAAGVAGSPGYVDAPGLSARFNNPTGIAVEGDLVNVYVADGVNHCIRKIDFTGVVTTFAGSSISGQGDGFGTGAKFSMPVDVAWDTAGYIFVTDTINNNIRRIHHSTASVVTVAGSGIAGFNDGTGALADFHSPMAIAARFRDVMVCDGANHAIRSVTPNGVVKTIAGTGIANHQNGTGSTAGFFRPGGIVRNEEGDYFISDTYNHCIRKMVVD